MEDNTAGTRSSEEAQMDRRLLEAATTGDSESMKEMALQNPRVLLGTTPQGNTCLHIASMHDQVGFCKDVLMLNQSLVAIVNSYGETPLLTAVTSGNASLATDLLRVCCVAQLSEAILKQDNNGCNVLHHAIRSGHRGLALEFIKAEPALSKAVNKCKESPMFIAAMRGFTDVFEKLLEIPDSANAGVNGLNPLHAAVRNENSVIAKRIMEARPWLAREENKFKSTPMHWAVQRDKIDVLRVLLEHDWSLGYVVGSSGYPLLVMAATRGYVDAARELLNHCPDVPYCTENGWTCLHEAVNQGHAEFVEFILRAPQLRKLVNMQDGDGGTALHYAAMKCDPKIVAALLSVKDIDPTMYDNDGRPIFGPVYWATDLAKTLNWNEVSMLLLKADPHAETTSHVHNMAKKKATEESRKNVKSLTQTYTTNTSLVAILIATITFAAAFTLPGGYSNDAGSEGLPIMARKLAFQAFLISDTLAMCSSLAVAFICIVARWEDFEFLLHYRSSTKKLMWFAYVATTVAFATGLYTVVAPRILWLAIGICCLSVLLLVVTKGAFSSLYQGERNGMVQNGWDDPGWDGTGRVFGCLNGTVQDFVWLIG